MPEKELKLYPASGFREVEEYYREFSELLTDSKTQACTFNLENISFIQPELLLPLITVSQIWYEKHRTPTIWKLPEKLIPYLHRLGIFESLQHSVSVNEKISSSWSLGNSLNLLELTPLSPDQKENYQDVQTLLKKCTDLFLGNVRQNQIGSLLTLISEISQNITHSRSIGHVFVQIYDGKRVHVAISDIGIGIQGSLASKYPNFNQVSVYIEKSLQAGVSSRNDTGGNGLFEVQKLVTEQGGALVIRSGTAMLTSQNGKIRCWDDLVYVPGTQIYISLWGLHQPPNWTYHLQ